MTNRLALVLGIVVLCALIIDAILFGMAGSFFLARKLVDLIEWLKFWR
ncbi:MAG: hypothetical protein AAFN80_01055 [Pseudomonadota bacterium]